MINALLKYLYTYRIKSNCKNITKNWASERSQHMGLVDVVTGAGQW